MSRIEHKSHALRDTLYNALIVLGIDQDTWLKKLQCPKSLIHRNMFQVPKTNIFQVVSYFLFSIIDLKKCSEDFYYCWPVGSKKEERSFRKICVSWLTLLSQQEGAQFPSFTPSILLSPSLDKFCNLYLAVARLALKKVFVEEFGESALLIQLTKSPEHNKSYFEMLLASKHRCLQMYKMRENAGLQRRNAFETNVKILVEQNHCLRKDIELNEKLLKANQAQEITDERLSQLRELWTRVKYFSTVAQETTRIIENTLGISQTSNEIDGKENTIEPSHNFIHLHRQKLGAASIDRIYDKGNLKMENLFKMLEIVLNSYYSSFNKMSEHFTSNTEELVTVFANLRSSHGSNFKSLLEINAEVESLMPSFEISIEKMKLLYDSSLSQNNTPRIDNERNKMTDLLRITPSFNQVAKKNSRIWTSSLSIPKNPRNTKYQYLRKTTASGSSPDLILQNKKLIEKDITPKSDLTSTPVSSKFHEQKSRIPIAAVNRKKIVNSEKLLFLETSKALLDKKDKLSPVEDVRCFIIKTPSDNQNKGKVRSIHDSPAISKCAHEMSAIFNSINVSKKGNPELSFTTGSMRKELNYSQQRNELISSLDETFMNETLPYNDLMGFSPGRDDSVFATTM